MHRISIIACFVGAVLASANAFHTRQSPYQKECSDDRTAWVAQSLARMESIKPGMTRAALLTVFTTEGGLSSGLQRRYVSRDCPYFKADAEFQPVGRPERAADGRVTLVEDDRDIIVKISRPYLQLSIFD